MYVCVCAHVYVCVCGLRHERWIVVDDLRYLFIYYLVTFMCTCLHFHIDIIFIIYKNKIYN